MPSVVSNLSDRRDDDWHLLLAKLDKRRAKGGGRAPAGVAGFANISFYDGVHGGTVGLDHVSTLSSENHPQRMNRVRPDVPTIHLMSRNSSATFGGFMTGQRRSPRDQRSVMAGQRRENGL